METTESLQIITDDSLSIADLTQLQGEGFSVMRSAHVGNLSPYNLALAQAGVRVLCVDHNLTGVDRNYIPESMLTQDAEVVIAPLDRLSSRVEVTDAVDIDVFEDAQFVDEAHIQAVRRALPSADIFTNTEYLQANESVVGEIVDVVLDDSPQVFNRVARSDGSVSRRPDAAAMVRRLGVMQLNDEPRQGEAVIMPNVIDILANFVVETLETEQPVQYHLSGPAMVKYIDQMVPELQRLYAKIKSEASFGADLPDRLDVRLVPTAEAKFATTMQRRPQLDAVLAAVEEADVELADVQADRKAFFASQQARDNDQRAQFLQGAKAREVAADEDVADKLAAIPELFAEPGAPGFITQYDVLEEDGLYVPERNQTASMAELAGLSKRLGKVRQRFRL